MVAQQTAPISGLRAAAPIETARLLISERVSDRMASSRGPEESHSRLTAPRKDFLHSLSDSDGRPPPAIRQATRRFRRDVGG